MKKKLIGMIVSMLLLTTIMPLTAIAGDEQNPEIKDKTGDMFRHVDIDSIWFYEDVNNPDYLYLSFKVRDLISKTLIFEAIYVVIWNFNDNYYAASINVFPDGASDLLSGKTDKNCNDYVSYVICNGAFDADKNIITWIIPKDAIGNPQPGDILTKIFASTHLRFPMNKLLPHLDLFKDLSWNALIKKDYTVQI